MDISVVVPTHNSAETLSATLESLMNQSTDVEYEVIVVDDGSTDDTTKVCEKFSGRCNFLYLRLEKTRGPALARNFGIKNASGKIVAFIDADCTASRYWLEEIYRSFGDGGDVVGVAGRIIYEKSINEVSVRDRVFVSHGLNQMSEDEMNEMYATANIAYKKSVLDEVHGFTGRYRYLHDFELAQSILRLKKGSILFNKDSIVFHSPSMYNILSTKLLHESSIKAEVLDYAIRNDSFGRLFLWRIFLPLDLLIILFPPALLLTKPYRCFGDLLFFPYLYLSKVYMRLLIWATAVSLKKFVI